MIKLKNILSHLLQILTAIITLLIVLSHINIYKRTSYICSISGSRKTVNKEYFWRTTTITTSSLEQWIKRNYDPNFKNNFIYRDSKTVPILRGTSRASGGRGYAITRLRPFIDEVVNRAGKEKLTELVEALVSKDNERSLNL